MIATILTISGVIGALFVASFLMAFDMTGNDADAGPTEVSEEE